MVPIVVIAVVAIAMFEIFVTGAFETLVGFVAFVGPVARIAAVRAETFDRFVITPVGVGGATVAVVPVVRLGAGRAREEQEPTEGGVSQDSFAENGVEQVRVKFHEILQGRARADLGKAS